VVSGLPNQSRSSTRKPSTRKTSTSRKSTKSTRAKSTKTTPKASANNGSTFSDVFYIIRNTLAGRILIAILMVLALVGLNLLLSLNSFNRFFTLLGAELVIGILVFWVVYLFRERNRDQEDT